MSASTEDLLLQIFSLEKTIKENKQSGSPTLHLEQKLQELQELFQAMNESLNNKGTLLKG